MVVYVNSVKDFIAAKQRIVQKTALDLNLVQTESDLKNVCLKNNHNFIFIQKKYNLQ